MDHIQHRDTGFTKIAVPTFEGFELIPADQVIHCEADDNYSHLYLKNKKRITACRTLKEIEEQMHDFGSFVRVHHSWNMGIDDAHECRFIGELDVQKQTATKKCFR